MTAVTVSSAARREPVVEPWYRSGRWRWVAGGAGVLVLAQIVLANISGSANSWSKTWNVHLGDPVRHFQSAVRRNRNSNFLLAHVLHPMSSFVIWFYEGIRDVLIDLPWFWLALAVFLVIARSGRWVTAVGATAGLLFIEVAGLHEPGMETVALMLICVVLSVAIGAPLGVWAGLNPKVERRMRPVLDALQSVPVTVYLVIAVVFFSIKQTPAAIATVAFAVPPMIRITALGIRQVPAASVEAGRIFGSTGWQLLWKVQLPQAVKSLVAAVNQTIMMCLGLVVIGSLVGAGGLGAELLKSTRTRSPGRGFIIGLAILAVAIGFDRLSRSLVDRARPLPIAPRTYWTAVAVIVVVAYLVGRGAGWVEVPWTFDRNIAKPIDTSIIWIRDHFSGPLQSINDFIVRDVIIRLRDLLGVSLAWPVLTVLTAGLAWFIKGWKFAVFCVGGLLVTGMLGMWGEALNTLAQIIVSVIVATLIAVPVGIFIGRRPRIQGVVEPFLDALQTLPSLIYAIPFVMLFAVGYVPGLLATVLYAIPPGIRLTALAIKQVNPEPMEAASTFGATKRQQLWGVQVPLALKGIALGVNQVIMMAMSMIIIAGQFGGGGLGFNAVSALIKQDTGLGVEVGISILVMAIILDRLSEGFADMIDPASAATTH